MEEKHVKRIRELEEEEEASLHWFVIDQLQDTHSLFSELNTREKNYKRSKEYLERKCSKFFHSPPR